MLTAIGEHNLAIEELLGALQIAKDTNTFLWFPMDLGYLGSAYAAIGDLNAGRKYLDEGIEAANNSEERIFEAELLRNYVGVCPKKKSIFVETGLERSQNNRREQWNGLAQ